ncbi:Hint domain-containing protein [Gluconobacter sp. Dm-62]|uniref:Hint domain-containing protein n=1 Tax=Gluconobacter sp. Dm-62 TaxID=2799804 RepID=UPI001B8BAF01|nr:Hint domain-containing protein [Gluconobacter sp. Dm-62]MBS1102357.1 Hint domain-containing protein [Gluconobacter sp. Dm-62]
MADPTGENDDTVPYNSSETSFHQHDYAWRWVGPDAGGDWSDASNWVLTDAGNPVDTTGSSFNGDAIPQSEQNADVNVGYYGDGAPSVVVSNAVLYNQIRSLSVWQNGILKITAQGGNGNVFATAGMENDGTVIIDTPSKVELGGVTSGNGTLTIMNNDGNVTFDDSYLNNGTLNLVNATLGTLASPVSIAGGTINLQQNSTLFANLYGAGATVNVDPATVNTLYVNDRYDNDSGSVQNTVINGVSENTHFGILNGSSQPTSATYAANSDGSYTLTITLENGRSITYPTVNVADGFKPAAQATIVQDGSNGWLIEDAGTETAPASYASSNLHQQLADTAAAAASAGGDTSQYSNNAASFHQHDNIWRWTGPESGGDWYDPSNWTLYDGQGNPIDTTGSSYSGNAVPQSEQNADVNVGYSGSTTPNIVVANAPSYNQIRSLSVWQNSTLEITAQGGSNYNGYVFATAGFENDGTILINTLSKVELGGVTMNRADGTITIINNDNNVVFDDNTVNNGGTINLLGSTLGTASDPIWINGGIVNLQQGSTLFLNPLETINTINVDPSTVNTVYVEANGFLHGDSTNTQSIVVNGVSANTHFGISGVTSAPVAATYTPNTDGSYTLQITLDDGRVLTFGDVNTAEGFTPASQATIVQDGANGWIVEDNGTTTCFLAGSMIRTPEGDVAVETLRLGSTVLAFVNGEAVERTVTWAGRARMVAKPGLSDAESGYPVRILKNALAEGVPYKDMLVTPEHCLFLKGGFVPARMLVNGRSVIYDRNMPAYDYFHVETAEHSVIMADGMLTESYLDTGNRHTFRQSGTVVSLGGRARTWNDDAAAPLTVSRDVVEPIFRVIEARAIEAGLESGIEAPVLTEDSGLHLVANTGQTIHQVREANGRMMFMIPSDVTDVRLVSRTSRPSETVGPFVDDRRHLGVLVGEVTLFDSGNTIRIDQHLTDANICGWDVLEDTAVRWTNGNATLPLTARQPNSFGMLAIQVLASGPYLLTSEGEAETARTA